MAGHIASSASVDWNTPENVVAALHELWDERGGIGCDPCSNDGSIVGAIVEYKLPKNDGLVDPWLITGRPHTAYVNPPFGSYYMNPETKEILLPKELKARCEALCVNPKKPTAEEKRAIKGLRSQYKRFTIRDWIRAAVEWHQQTGLEVVMLIPVQPGTRAWQQYVLKFAAAICWMKGRPKFRGAKAGAPMDCALVYFGDESHEFARVFSKLGHVDDRC